MEVNHNALVLVGKYLFADKVKSEVLSLLRKDIPLIRREESNVKCSMHTIWNWEPDNITFRNLKSYIREQIETNFTPGKTVNGDRNWLYVKNFWANVYEKGDYAQDHCHKPNDFSFAYFVKSKWYDSPLVFTYSGKRVRPKEGRYVIFPGYLKHHVPKHRYNDTRITLSGNLAVSGS